MDTKHKTEQNRIDTIKKKSEVEKDLKEYTMEQVDRRFRATDEREKNADKVRKLWGTMYWM